MSWLGSFGVAVLASLAGGGAALLVALGWSSWFRWSTFEGASGYAIVAWVLGGLLLGLVLGLVVSRLVDAGAAHAFARAVGIAVGILGVSAGALAAGGRVLADVPPEIDGEQLMLMVEVRWPATQRERPSRSDASALRLGAVGGGVERRSERGPLWTEDMRQIDGRWVATGAVALFTERRDRALSVALGDVPADTASHAFLVPLPRRPGRAELQWSPWLPRMREGATALPGGLTYRFRVQRRSEPVRTQRFGDFEVSTVASGFSEPDDGTGRPSATSTFVVRHRGRPLVVDGASPLADDAVRAVTVVAAPRPALLELVRGDDPRNCALLIDDATRVRAERVAACDYALTAHPLTADVARYRAARRPPAPGWVDHTSLGEPGDYLVGDAILDTRSLVVRPVPPDPTSYPVQEVPPLGLSPDRRSVVRLVRPTDAARSFALGVTDVVAARSYHLPLDPLRMRFASEKVIDPGWVAHHFEWTRGADGVERLTERRLFEPLPFRGTLMPERPGAAAFYSVQPAGDALRDALRDALGKLVQEEFDGERLPSHANREGWRLRIGDTIVDVASVVGGDEPFVAISVEAGTDERHLVPRIAARVDGALATGRYDALFVRP